MAQKTVTINANSGDCFATKVSDGLFNNTDDFLRVGGGTGINTDPWDWIGFTVNIAQGKQIVSATLRLIPTQTFGTGVDGSLCCEAIDNSVTPTDNGSVRSKTVGTEVNVVYGTWTLGVAVDLDFTTVVQEVFNRAGWLPNNQLGIVIKDLTTGNNNQRLAASTRNATYNPPQLIIVYNSFIPTTGDLL